MDDHGRMGSSTNSLFCDRKIRFFWKRVTEILQMNPLMVKKYDEMPHFCRERHIQIGYRPNPSSVSYCIRSVFHPTNETLNFWTHFLPLLFLVVRHYNLSKSLDWNSEEVKTLSSPFWAYSAGCCVLLGCSSFAHLFNCVSARVRHLCFCTDYGAISIYSVAGTIVYFYLISPPHCHGFNPDHSTFYIPSATALSIISHIACCYTRFPHVKFRYLLRTLAYIMPFLAISTPTMIRFSNHISMWLEHIHGSGYFTVSSVAASQISSVKVTSHCAITYSDSNSDNNDTCISTDPLLSNCNLGEQVFPTYYLLHLFFFLMAAIFNVSRFPEKNFPGQFDVIGSSHQFFHIAIALGIIAQSVIAEEALYDAIRRPGIPESSPWLSAVSTSVTMGWLVFVSSILAIVIFIYGNILPCHSNQRP